MNSAIALHCDYAYVDLRTGGSHPNAGVLIVDVAVPVDPTVIGKVGSPDAREAYLNDGRIT